MDKWEYDSEDQEIREITGKDEYSPVAITTPQRAKQICHEHNTYQELVEALEKISKGSGEFSRDPIEHASNCIVSMKEIANNTLKLAKGEK